MKWEERRSFPFLSRFFFSTSSATVLSQTHARPMLPQLRTTTEREKEEEND